MPWNNADGLTVFFAGELRQYEGGEFPGAGANRTIEIEIDPASLTTTAQALGEPWIIVPRNSVIESVEVISETALVGGTSITIGLQRKDGTTELDYDGLVAALPIANLNVNGEKNVLTAGVTYAGALVGTETAYPGHITALAAGTFSAGRLVVRVNLYVKDVDQNPDNY